MKKYTYQNTLISKKQLKEILYWSFIKYGSIKACFLADKLKYLGFKYATQAGISISIEDLRVPYVKKSMVKDANQEILKAEKIYFKGKTTDVERFQKIIDTWDITSELLKEEVVSFFKHYDPLNSVYMMAFSGARGNLSQVRQLVGMRGLMSDSNGEILKLPIQKNFREGLSITDYLMSGYGARKGIVDTALKTANSGYLTRRLIDVAQDIIIREKDCLTPHSFILINKGKTDSFYNPLVGCLINKPIYDPKTNILIADINTQITPNLIRTFKQKRINRVYIRSPLTCELYRSICQKCYGWNLASENLVNMGESIGIIAGQSIGEPGTQLTMRTFHTGGIFTSEYKVTQQIKSPIAGLIIFSNLLKTKPLRTNKGENVLLIQSSGSLSIILDEKNNKNLQLELPKNTILFVKNRQYVKKNSILGELAGDIKQVRTEIKQVFAQFSGEVIMRSESQHQQLISRTKNNLFWILSGQVYRAPRNSFLNFYPDFLINKNSFIFRSKVINQQPGFIKLINSRGNLFEQSIEITSKINNDTYCLNNSDIQQLSYKLRDKNSILTIKNLKYLVSLESKNSDSLIVNIPQKSFATLITNRYKSRIGGIYYYNQDGNQEKKEYLDNLIYFLKDREDPYYRTLIWLPEETYTLNCSKNLLLFKPNSYVSENFEIISNIYSKISGIIKVTEKNNIVQEILIKPGIVYIYNDINNFDNKIFYPGEVILNTIEIDQLSLCEVINLGLDSQLLIRPLEIYEVPLPKSINFVFDNQFSANNLFDFSNRINYLYNSGQKIKSNEEIDLLNNVVDFKLKAGIKKESVKIIRNTKQRNLKFLMYEKLCLIDYLLPSFRYSNIQFCPAVEVNQFVNAHTTLGYLEIVSSQSLQLVQFKIKRKQIKEILLISNDDCITVEKEKVKNKTINNILVHNISSNQIGKIIMDNGKFVTIQKGRPYFFPKCINTALLNDKNIKYKWVSNKNSSIEDILRNRKSLNINYIHRTSAFEKYIPFSNSCKKLNFPMMLLKKQGKHYTSSIPVFAREFLIKEENTPETRISKLDYRPWCGYRDHTINLKSKKIKLYPNREAVNLNNIYMLFVKSSELKSKISKISDNKRFELGSVALLQYPLKKIGIHSITEDYIYEEINTVFCENGEFIENNQIIGLLNFDKEITGDIVQGLPKIEQLLEARRKKQVSKNTPKAQKKGLLTRKTTINTSFEFQKMGTVIKEDEKINPHILLKIYFNYYLKVKHLACLTNSKLVLCCLSDNYEGSYRSFKKVQSFILNSVQSVYQSQGVTIADKHLEIIIKQMTTKVVITHEGKTPLLPKETVDLYHIKYINEVVKRQKKQVACYVPLLLGITKSALNNPSFLSAASFQETTRVLTKAAIEGRLDWLRGLKENIITGHLIPSGTGSKSFVTTFNKYLSTKNNTKAKSLSLKNS